MAEVFMTGDIVDDADLVYESDMSPIRFRNLTEGVEDEVVIRMTSGGGSVFSGLSIVSMIDSLRAKGVKTRCEIMGLSASIASVIACACDEVVFNDQSWMMIHLPFCGICGNANDFRKEAETLDQILDSLVKVYQRKFDLTKDELVKLMEAETWINAEMLEGLKFKGEVKPCPEEYMIAASMKLSRAMKNYKNLPEVLKMSEKMIDVCASADDECKKAEEVSKDAGEVEKQDVETDEDSSGDAEKAVEEVDEDAPGPAVDVPDGDEEVCVKTDEEVKKDAEQVSKDEPEPEAECGVCETQTGKPKNEVVELVDKLEKCEQKRRDFQAKVDVMKNELEKLHATNKSLTDEIEKVKMDASIEKSQLMSEKKELETRLARLADSVFKVPTAEVVETREAREVLASLPPSERNAYYKAHKAEIDG